MRTYVLTLLTLTFLAACSEPPNTPRTNLPPETYLALTPDGDLRTSTSRQHVHWWGDDPDGFVIGYLISFDQVAWRFTTRNDSVFALSLAGSDTTYAFAVRAVDDQGNGVWDADGPYGSEPYTDENDNSQYDAGEPFIDFGLADPTPAELRYPIENSPPVVRFTQGSDVPERTFPVATFSWIGSDLDGDETIREYQYALNDTLDDAAWKSLPRTTTFLTLRAEDGLRAGENAFYLRAVDIAGATSRIIRMPDTSRTWTVRFPTTELLIVDDYGPADASADFYQAIVDTLFGGRFAGADVFDIKTGASSTTRGTYLPPYTNPTFIETLKLFKYVLWYTDNDPTIDVAQVALPEYQRSGGMILYTAAFPESAVDPRGGITDYAPVDSLSPEPIRFVPAGTQVEADSESPGYPTLVRDSQGVPVAFIRNLFRRINARNLYRFEESTRWEGQPVVAVRSGDRRFVLFGIPLHRFNAAGNVGALIHLVFRHEFGVM
ncbi:MAG: hypothetical protein RBU27_03110 [Bacteroidota bacterium]|jgi:hypothetical protein|nr:hypothetical protein [Bacteroidota bacterium]